MQVELRGHTVYYIERENISTPNITQHNMGGHLRNNAGTHPPSLTSISGKNRMASERQTHSLSLGGPSGSVGYMDDL